MYILCSISGDFTEKNETNKKWSSNIKDNLILVSPDPTNCGPAGSWSYQIRNKLRACRILVSPDPHQTAGLQDLGPTSFANSCGPAGSWSYHIRNKLRGGPARSWSHHIPNNLRSCRILASPAPQRTARLHDLGLTRSATNCGPAGSWSHQIRNKLRACGILVSPDP